MRKLAPAPNAFLDPSSGKPAIGSYFGALPRVELGRHWADRLLRQKKWTWAGIATDDLWISAAALQTGYASSAFGFAFDRRRKRLLANESTISSRRAVQLTDDVHADGVLAAFESGHRVVRLERARDRIQLRVRLRDLDVEAEVDVADCPPGVAAIARLGNELVSSTEKVALARVRGCAVAAGTRFGLNEGLAGFDYTNGMMPRRTRWRWAFALGRTTEGDPIGFNLTEGFVGEAECAAFHRGRVIPLGEPWFRSGAIWRLDGEGMSLEFEPGAVHEQASNLILVRSRFVQPVGSFRGELDLDGRRVVLAGVPGVVEDQDVVW